MWTSGPSIFLSRTSTCGIAVVELTSSSVSSPPRGVGDRKPPSNGDCADVVDPKTEAVSVNDLESVRSRIYLESTEVLMHILPVGESILQGELNCLCSHKAEGLVDNDSAENLVSTVDITLMGSLEVRLNQREALEHRNIEVMLRSGRICQQELLVDRIRMKGVVRDRTAGLELLSLVDINISSIRNLSMPVLSLFISAFPGGYEILQGSGASSQIVEVFEREKVEIPFVGRWKMCYPLDFLFEVVVYDLPRLGLVDRR